LDIDREFDSEVGVRNISEQELKDILDKHGKWLRENTKDKEWKISSLMNFSYFVSSNGNIASIITPALSIRKNPKLISKRKSSNGYLSVRCAGKNILVHRVVADAFLGKVGSKVVHHKNSKRDDNRASNLQITNHSNNNSKSFVVRKKMYGDFIKSCADKFQRGLFEAKP